ncbi:Rhamnogalacturonate lyase family protein [Euphorbia peplus]|nr:Rhamnogalacturonate lyase family protein [Euphorbia peplus]
MDSQKFFIFLFFSFSLLFSGSPSCLRHISGDIHESPPPVTLQIQNKYAVVDNGFFQVSIAIPEGFVAGIQYNGIANLLEVLNDEADRGYWDLVWSDESTTRKKGNFDRMDGTTFKVVVENEEHIELSFSRTWNSSLHGQLVPLNIDKRFIVKRGSSGMYTYAIYEHLKEWPAFNLDNTRLAFKLRKDKFDYMAISERRQRYMPSPDDRLKGRGEVLAYPEAVLLVDPIKPQFKGEVDDKYEYACESINNRVHGWISNANDTSSGFWLITPSYEFRSGGPLKQYLTSHVGPTSLSVFHSTHYAGADMIMEFGENEEWKKVYGPIFIYLNSNSGRGDPLNLLWEDANQQVVKEVESWPYQFVASQDFPPSDQRANLYGTLLILDRHISKDKIFAKGAHIGLAAPGDAGSWQTESKGYQFWTTADEEGNFKISNIRPGSYNLYAWVPGFIGDYKYDPVLNISPGSDEDIGDVVYEPPRNGSTLWEIGIPDRTAAEFYVPDPNPLYVNKLYLNHTDRFRQYGLWERYAELYPDGDLNFTVGTSDYTKDWFFAQVPRKKSNNTYEGTTWQIKFNLDTVNETGIYTLRLALATANVAILEVRINDGNSNASLVLATEKFGKDNTIARHGIHGLYRLFNVEIQGSKLVSGMNNTIFFTQPNKDSPFQGLMYDYIRLEAPPSIF